MKKLNQSTNQFAVWLFIMVITAFTGVAQPPAPATVSIQAKDTHRAVVRWSLSAGATAYKVLLSEDSITFTEAATIGADTIFAHVSNLNSGTTYNVHVVASNAEGVSAPTATKFTTIVPALKIHIPLDTLNADGHIVEAISSATVAPAATGQLVVQDAATSGLGIPAIRFVQDELEGIASWADITSFIVGNEINTNLMSRTFSLWIKNENPSLYTVPLSIEKRTGMTIAFKNDSIYVMDKQRPGVPDNNPYMTFVGAPYGTSEWTLVTYVFDDPYTKLYLNGVLAATSNPGPWIFPAAWQVGTGDKNGEIGALKDPCAALQAFLQNTWDVGPRNFFSGSLANIKMYNSALSDDDILKEYLAVVAPPTPTGVMVQARDTNRAIIRWNMVEGATGYKVYVSTDGESFTESAEVADVNFAHISNLTAATEYYVHVVSKDTIAESFPAEVMLTTISPALSIHIPLDSLTSEGHVYEALNSLTVAPVGQLVVQAGTENGLGIGSTRFVQDELEGIASWANITSFIVGNEINSNLMSRTFSLWIKNENPSLYTVPLSIEKRTGMTIAFKNDSIYVMDKQRPGVPDNNPYMTFVGAPYGTSEWTLVTYVFDDPYTKLYLNGVLAATSDPGPWIFPAAWQVGTGDKNGEIGALKDPCAALQAFLQNTWDVGTRNFFSGSLANIKMYNSALSDKDILKEYLAVVAPPTPTGVVVQARDTDRAIIRWNMVEGATGYKVYVSTDGESFTESAEVADVNFAHISSLTAATEYYVHVVSKDTIAESFPAEVMLTTTNPALSVHIPLDSLTAEGHVYEAVNNLTIAPVGQLVVEAGTENGLGIASTKFVQDELEGISSWANITSFLVSTEINANLMSRTFSLWIKNENPSAYTVPLSIEKRTGMSIAFKNDSIYAFMKQRPQYPAGVDWIADMVGVPYGTSEWSLVTVVYDDPHTKLYLNGMLVGTSPGGEWIFPRAWQIGTGDKNAEIGALKDPSAGLVQYLGDTWDPGVRNNFSGKLADIKMFNYALSDADVMALFADIATAPSGFVAQAITTDEVLLKWNAVEVETGFKVEYSADGETYTESGVAAADAVVHRVTGLTPDMEYHFKVTPVTSGLTAPAMVTATTVAPALVAQFNFAELGAGGTAIVENISGTEEVFLGDFKLEDVDEVIEMENKTYELNLKSLKITQDELGGVQSYVRLYESILAVAPSLLGRSMTLWIKNTDPTLWTVPFSAEKRTGFAIAFKDEHIWALTKHRPRYPEGIDWVADGVSYPFNSDAWTHVAYVYHDPYTSLYINGAKVATSEGGDWVFPTNIQIAAGGDKSASLGSLLDPDASMVEFLEDNWDPGARRFFDGSVADLRFFNYDLEEDEVAAIMMESLTDITNVSNTAFGNVKVFPNPASYKLTIDAMGDNVEIGIYNIAGSLMISREVSGVEQIDISALEAGIYLIKVRNGNSIGVKKFSVLR